MYNGCKDFIMTNKSPQQSFLHSAIKNVASGTTSGIAVCLVGHPFDTLKVRLQTQPVHNPVYKGLWDCVVKTLRWEGIGGLYRGVGSPIVGQMFFRVTLFTSYFEISSYIAGSERQNQRLRASEYFLCGACTGFVASFAEGPIDLFKTKMQIEILRAKSGEPAKYRNVFHAAYTIAKGYGMRGVYQGLPATFMRDIPGFGAYFGFYELVRTHLTPEGKTVADIPALYQFIAGGCGGCMFWILTYPTDVVKSAMQADDSDRRHRKFVNVRDCIVRLYTEEGGVKRFYRGFLPCMMRAMPVNATQFLVMEKTRQWFTRFEG